MNLKRIYGIKVRTQDTNNLWGPWGRIRSHYADEPAITELVVFTVLTEPSTDVPNN